MLSVPALYENGKIILFETIPHLQRARLIVTVLEELPVSDPAETSAQGPAGSWLGSMSHTIGGVPVSFSYPIKIRLTVSLRRRRWNMA